jgi:predicted nucleotidyltransferase
VCDPWGSSVSCAGCHKYKTVHMLFIEREKRDVDKEIVNLKSRMAALQDEMAKLRHVQSRVEWIERRKRVGTEYVFLDLWKNYDTPPEPPE